MTAREKKDLSSYPLTGYILFISLGLIIFFITSFMVLQFRTKSHEQVMVPDLIGKRYTDVHNELMRIQFKVKIEHKRNPEKNDGIIIKQSIAPGKLTEAGSKIYLTVNIGTDMVTMPDLRNQPLNTAKSNLDNVLSGEIYVKMPLGGITYIEATSDQQPETVIGQIPEPGKQTDTSEKVYLLVTEPVGKKLTEDMTLQPFDLLYKKMNRSGQKWKAVVVPVKKRDLSGLVESVKKTADETVFKINYLAKDYAYESGYEKVSWKAENSGSYKATLSKEGQQDEAVIFNNIHYNASEPIEFVFYRTGKQTVKIYTNNSQVADFTYESTL